MTESGGYATAGSHTVTIGSGRSATLNLATVDDAVDEPNGSVTATIQSGSGYDVGSSSAATVAVNDDDEPPPPSRISVGVGSITASEATAIWAAVANAERYMVRWRVSGDRSGTLEYGPVLTNRKDLTGLQPGTSYQVEVVVRVGGVWEKAITGLPVEFPTPAE